MRTDSDDFFLEAVKFTPTWDIPEKNSKVCLVTVTFKFVSRANAGSLSAWHAGGCSDHLSGVQVTDVGALSSVAKATP